MLKSFIGVIPGGGGAVAVYTVPAGKTFIISYLVLPNINLASYIDRGGIHHTIFDTYNILQEGDTLVVDHTYSHKQIYAISGEEVDATNFVSLIGTTDSGEDKTIYTVPTGKQLVISRTCINNSNNYSYVKRSTYRLKFNSGDIIKFVLNAGDEIHIYQTVGDGIYYFVSGELIDA